MMTIIQSRRVMPLFIVPLLEANILSEVVESASRRTGNVADSSYPFLTVFLDPGAIPPD
jgi:hypothetical protein